MPLQVLGYLKFPDVANILWAIAHTGCYPGQSNLDQYMGQAIEDVQNAVQPDIGRMLDALNSLNISCKFSQPLMQGCMKQVLPKFDWQQSLLFSPFPSPHPV